MEKPKQLFGLGRFTEAAGIEFTLTKSIASALRGQSAQNRTG